jgi:hypothetical protein
VREQRRHEPDTRGVPCAVQANFRSPSATTCAMYGRISFAQLSFHPCLPSIPILLPSALHTPCLRRCATSSERRAASAKRHRRLLLCHISTDARACCSKFLDYKHKVRVAAGRSHCALGTSSCSCARAWLHCERHAESVACGEGALALESEGEDELVLTEAPSATDVQAPALTGPLHGLQSLRRKRIRCR